MWFSIQEQDLELLDLNVKGHSLLNKQTNTNQTKTSCKCSKWKWSDNSGPPTKGSGCKTCVEYLALEMRSLGI